MPYLKKRNRAKITAPMLVVSMYRYAGVFSEHGAVIDNLANLGDKINISIKIELNLIIFSNTFVFNGKFYQHP